MLKNILFSADGDRVHPGKQLAWNAPGLTIGAGIYQKDSFLFAGTVGFLHVEKMAEIDPSICATDPTWKLSIGQIKTTVRAPHDINIGDEVYGRVEKIRDDSAFVHILCINDRPTEQYYDGILKKKDIRPLETDKIQIEECF